jgi:CheY-like chemotaxis protein
MMKVRPNECKPIILCVDDEQNALLVRQRVLEKDGYEVIPASSVSQALNVLELRSVDLVLTDLLMPGGTGAELADEVRLRWPRVPVIVLSGVNEIPENLSAHLFLNKLEGPVSLCRRVREVLLEFQFNRSNQQGLPHSYATEIQS